jgi:hypothetical protein
MIVAPPVTKKIRFALPPLRVTLLVAPSMVMSCAGACSHLRVRVLAA